MPVNPELCYNALMTDLISQRLRSHGLLESKDKLAETLQDAICVQAQAQREAEINLFLRYPGLTQAELQENYVNRTLIKSWANRWTLHLMTPDDWLLLISARQSERLPKSYFSGHVELGMLAIEALTELLQEQKELRRRDFEDFLIKKFPVFPFKSYLIFAVLQTLMARGVCYFEATHPFSDFLLIANFQPLLDEETALKILIERFQKAFAPANFEDFVKWLGIKKASCRKLWQERDFHPKAQSLAGKTLIAARFDSLLTGYADKTWLTPEDRLPDMWSKNGILMAPIIQEGVLVGKWSHKLAGERVQFKLDSWAPYDEKAVQDKLLKIADFLNKKADF